MLDINKPVQTREGRPVRLICTDKKGPQPLVGLVTIQGDERVFLWTADGKRFFDIEGPDNFDLVNFALIDTTRPVQTKNGKKVRIVRINKKSGYPIIGLITPNNPEDTTEKLAGWTWDGRLFLGEIDDVNDLENVPEE